MGAAASGRAVREALPRTEEMTTNFGVADLASRACSDWKSRIDPRVLVSKWSRKEEEDVSRVGVNVANPALAITTSMCPILWVWMMVSTRVLGDFSSATARLSM